MKNWIKLSVKRRLHIAFLVLLLIPSLSIGITSYYTAKQRVQEQVLEKAKGDITLLNQLVTKLIEPQLQNVELLSENIHEGMYQSRTSPQVMDIIHQFQRIHPEISSAYVGTEAGFLIMDGSEKLPADYDTRKRPWYQQGWQANGKTVLTAPYLDMVTGEIVVGIVKKTKDGSGVVGVDLNLKKLNEMAQSMKTGTKGYVFIVDQTKKILAHPAFKKGADAPESIVVPLFNQRSGSFDTTESEEQYKTFFVTNEQTGWKIGGTINISELKAQASPIFYTTITVIIAALILGGVMVYTVISSITRPLHKLMHASEAISQGNLTERIPIESSDEFARLATRFNQMSDSLQSVLHHIMDKAEHLAASSEELMQGAKETSHAVEHVSVSVQEIAAGSEKQAKSIEETSTTIAEMSETMRKIAQSAQQTSVSVAHTSTITSQGNEAVSQAVQQMDCISEKITSLSDTVIALNERSKQIENFVEVITDIAEQTNLLSLNAAIEAARAGEHGKGFAVVADEVRKLAEQSSQSAGNIATLIRTIQHEMKKAVISMEEGVAEVKKGIQAVNLAGSSFHSIHDSIEEVAGQVHEVSASVQEMSAGAESISHSIRLVTEIAENTATGMQGTSATTEEQLAAMEEISASAKSLAHMAEELEEIIKKFTL